MYIENTDTRAGRRGGIHPGAMLRYLCTTKNGLTFLLFQFITIPIAIWQHWSGGSILIYYALYSGLTFLTTFVLSLVRQTKNPTSKEDVYFNGQKAVRVGQWAGRLIMIIFFAPAFFLAFTLSPAVASVWLAERSSIIVLLPLIQVGLFVHHYFQAEKKGLVDGVDSGDIARTFTFILAPYFRLGGLGYLVTRFIAMQAVGTDLIVVMIIIGIVESGVYALEFAPGALPLVVTNR